MIKKPEIELQANEKAHVVFTETVIPRNCKVSLERMDFFVHMDWLHKQSINVLKHLPKKKRSKFIIEWYDAITEMIALGVQYRYATKTYRLTLIADITKKQAVYAYYLNLLSYYKVISDGLYMEIGKRMKSMEQELIKMYNANKQQLNSEKE